MSQVFQPLLFLLARSTHGMLARQVEFLKAENKMLRRRVPKQKIHLDPKEKALLVKLGQAVGTGVRHLITVVSYSAYSSWVRAAQEDLPLAKKRGRPRTAEFLCKLILRLAREKGWGYTRVMGEIKKLGMKPPSRNTVKNILKANGLKPGPKRGQGSWDEFLKIHAETLWQCDFFSKKIWTSRGLQQYFVLVFLHVDSRKVFVTKASKKPDAAWMKRQAEAFIRQGMRVDVVMRDRDGMFVADFDTVLKDAGAKVVRTAVRAPNQNAFVERWVQSIKHESLNHFIVFGEDHFNFLISEYVEHYLTERPHQGLGNVLPICESMPYESDEPPENEIFCRHRLGGLLKHYYRAAA